MANKWPNRLDVPERPARDFLDNKKNWRIHPIAQRRGIVQILNTVGKVKPLLAYNSERYGGLTLYDGHLRKDIDPDETWPVIIADLTDEEADFVIMTLDAVTPMVEIDYDILDSLVEDVGPFEEDIAAILATLDVELPVQQETGGVVDGNGDEKDGDELPIFVEQAPDAIWPSDNEWGVPLLDIEMQATSLDLPVSKWGDAGRSKKMLGTYHFYTDDYKFSALWKNPEKLLISQCRNAIEPNFSTNDQMPKAVVLWGIYRKRWIARYWQSHGVKVFVDLAIAPRFRDLSLLGVPQGWNAYATYSYSDEHDKKRIHEEYELAKEHAGDKSILFAVYGWTWLEEECKKNGWIWIPNIQYDILVR